MASLKDLVAETTAGSQGFTEALWYARIAAPLPADLSEMMYVIIPDINPLTKFGPCRWNTSQVVTLDADCLVAFDNRGQPWVLEIW